MACPCGCPAAALSSPVAFVSTVSEVSVVVAAAGVLISHIPLKKQPNRGQQSIQEEHRIITLRCFFKGFFAVLTYLNLCLDVCTLGLVSFQPTETKI